MGNRRFVSHSFYCRRNRINTISALDVDMTVGRTLNYKGNPIDSIFMNLKAKKITGI